MDLLKTAEEQLDILRTLHYAKVIAKATIEAAVGQGAREDELKLACELALAAYREGAEVYKQYYAKIHDELDAAFGARKGEKKPPTPEGKRLERLLNTNFKPGSVYVKLEVHSDKTKETCIAKIQEEQAERMIEQLMACPEDCSEEV